MKGIIRAASLAAMVLAVPACGDGGGGGSGSAGFGPVGEPDMTENGFYASSGSAVHPPADRAGQAGPAGVVDLKAAAGIAFGPGADAPAGPSAPSAPPGGRALTSADLAADVSDPGSLGIAAALTTSGGGSVRSVRAGGDLLVSGSLAAAAGQGLHLEAGGTLYVSGSVRTTARSITLVGRRIVLLGSVVASGDAGEDAGDVVLRSTALPLVLSGAEIRADGGPGEDGGDGGDVLLSSGAGIQADADVSARGGSGVGGDGARGGVGGAITLRAAGDSDVKGRWNARGGLARASGTGAQGGDGGAFDLEAGWAAVRMAAVVDVRGGGAEAFGGSGLLSGAGGAVRIGSGVQVRELDLAFGRIEARGGSADAQGGAGGTCDFFSNGGDILFAGTVNLGGGASDAAPGRAGALRLWCDVGGGTLTWRGSFVARGGNARTAGLDAPGGRGGEADLWVFSDGGGVVLTTSASADLAGGSSTGAGKAGDGGEFRSVSAEGAVSMSGSIVARGGDAMGAGEGGRGGVVHVISDNNGSGTGGDITIQADFVADLSGGNGAVGGHARHDLTSSASTNPNLSAFVLDSDSAPRGVPNAGGIIRQNGTIRARGGANNGWGGDSTFHGRGHDTFRDPQPGNMDLSGHGSGQPGNFLSD